ncbi:hypothetical protein WKK05_36175 (plasmid) [Nostoc sp. UHCC 0302]|uniref:hypothetical protein n=1 Tax=Nostoc sp. UHCC 0302 TaxID=3134896 RepID=UPI00311C925F
MKIEQLKLVNNRDFTRVSANVVWEDIDRPVAEIYIETTAEFAQDLSCNPNSFLLACIMVAFYYGEKRVFIDAEICPELHDGLVTAMSWMLSWYGLERQLVQIEAKTKLDVPTIPKVNRAGMFFSGGIDALATLRTNRLKFGLEHPASIKDGLIIYGIANTTLDSFEKAIISLSPIAKDAGINLIPVYTNIYAHVKDLESSNFKFWKYYFSAAALAAVAHAFNKRLGLVYVASSFAINYVSPWGTHPLLDPNYSSYNLQIKHDNIALSRLDKTKLLADWDVGLQNLRVCDQLTLPHGYLNCGQCGKCSVTVAALAALGALKKTNVFPLHYISEELLLKQAHPQDLDDEANYLSLIPLFESQNRNDLVRGIKRVSTRFRWKTRLKQLKKIFLE